MNRVIRAVSAVFIAIVIVCPVEAISQSNELNKLVDDLSAAKSVLAQVEKDNEEEIEEYLHIENARALTVFPKLQTIGAFFWKSVNGRGFFFLPGVDKSGRKQWRLAWYEEYIHKGPGIAFGGLESKCIKVIQRRNARQENRKEYDYIHEGNIFLTDEVGVAIALGITIPIDDANVEISCYERGLILKLGTFNEPKYKLLYDFDKHGFDNIPQEERELICDLTCMLNDDCLKMKSCSHRAPEAVK